MLELVVIFDSLFVNMLAKLKLEETEEDEDCGPDRIGNVLMLTSGNDLVSKLVLSWVI